jgi:hypothetical protein
MYKGSRGPRAQGCVMASRPLEVLKDSTSEGQRPVRERGPVPHGELAL